MHGMVTPARPQGVPDIVSHPQPEFIVKIKRFRGDHRLPVFLSACVRQHAQAGDIRVRQSA